VPCPLRAKAEPTLSRETNVAVTGVVSDWVKFEGVNTFYGKSHILHDATLDVRRGEIVALLGRNGAGKSTLLKTLAGLIPLTSGTIKYDGGEIAGLLAADIARMGIGYVP
jgi:branched-chain amino acid transport system ATP-binding protein/branched-chain amino acid transport system permease protein